MESHNLLFGFLNKFILLSQADFDAIIAPNLIVRKFKRKEIITATGSVEVYFNFIISGLARKFFKRDAEEINTQLSTEGQIIHSQESFHSQRPSGYTVQAIEATT